VTKAGATRPNQVLGFIAWLALSIATSGIGALASVNARSFYADLVRPVWAPPGWVFGPVWSALFLAMAVSAWLVWRVPQQSKPRSLALSLFVVQLAANALWSWLFFAWHLGGPAFIEVLLLWLLIAATIVAFWRIRPIAGLLLVPYLAWVTFASALNYTLWQLNPAVLG
jgi:tryptophan-rich sensory protein